MFSLPASDGSSVADQPVRRDRPGMALPIADGAKGRNRFADVYSAGHQRNQHEPLNTDPQPNKILVTVQDGSRSKDDAPQTEDGDWPAQASETDESALQDPATADNPLGAQPDVEDDPVNPFSFTARSGDPEPLIGLPDTALVRGKMGVDASATSGSVGPTLPQVAQELGQAPPGKALLSALYSGGSATPGRYYASAQIPGDPENTKAAMALPAEEIRQGGSGSLATGQSKSGPDLRLEPGATSGAAGASRPRMPMDGLPSARLLPITGMPAESGPASGFGRAAAASADATVHPLPTGKGGPATPDVLLSALDAQRSNLSEPGVLTRTSADPTGTSPAGTAAPVAVTAGGQIAVQQALALSQTRSAEASKGIESERSGEVDAVVKAAAAQTVSKPILGPTIAPETVAQVALQRQMLGIGNPLDTRSDDKEGLLASLDATSRTALASEARGASVPTPTASAPMAQSASVQIAQAAISSNGARTELVLDPEELGKVRLSMITDDRSITLHVLADRPETLDLLRRNIDLLGQEFRSLGYNDVSFAFGEQAPSEGQADPSDNETNRSETTVADPDADLVSRTSRGGPKGHLDIRL